MRAFTRRRDSITVVAVLISIAVDKLEAEGVDILVYIVN